ncbi:MAG: FAD-dependent oxidoreductase [Woeseia sp.]
MHVVVLGAGVVGVSSAYYLARQGCEVTLIDRAAEPAAGTSHANGGQLAYSFVDAMAQPSLLPSIPGMIAGRDPAMCVRPFASPSMIRWGLSFLSQCTAARARENTLAVLRLAQQSAIHLAELREATGIEFGFAKAGKVMLLPPGADLKAAHRSITSKKAEGCESSLLPLAEVVRRFPELGHFPLAYEAALYAPDDEVGDARVFSQALAGWLQRHHALECRYGVTADSLELRRERVVGVRCGGETIAADAVLVCLGVQSRGMLSPLGVNAPIYPLRGYSVTLPVGSAAPKVSVTDMRRRIVFSTLGGRVRIAGLADFVGDDHSRDAARVLHLLTTGRRIAPDYAIYDNEDCAAWAGDRPMTPDGRPLVGATKVPGLYLNTGHGMLGWTLAAASAQQAAAAITAAGN